MRRPREEDGVAAGLIGPGRRWGRSDIGAGNGLLIWCDDPGRRMRSPRVRSAPGGGGAFRTSDQAFACGVNCGNTREEEWCCRLCYRPREEVEPRKNLFQAVSGFFGDVLDHRAVNAQISQFAVGQSVKFANGLIEQTPTVQRKLDRFRDIAKPIRNADGQGTGRVYISHNNCLNFLVLQRVIYRLWFIWFRCYRKHGANAADAQ